MDDFAQELIDELDGEEPVVDENYCNSCGSYIQSGVENSVRCCPVCGYQFFCEKQEDTQIGHSHKSQFNKLYNDMVARSQNCVSNKVIKNACEDYLSIRQRADRNFVRRGNVKRQIIAALIYYKAIRHGTPRKKNVITDMVGLNSNGIATGCREVINAVEKYDVPINLEEIDKQEMISAFAHSFLGRLEISDRRIYDFVVTVVVRSEDRMIGRANQLTSKIAGTISSALNSLGYEFKDTQIEKACDNCKKNTFGKFSDILARTYHKHFIDLYEQYQVPPPCKSRK